MRTWILTLIILGMTVTSVSAEGVKCPVTSPINLPITHAFISFVDNEYFKKGMPWGERGVYGYGHALGRLARAVQSQTDRHEAFECVKLAVEQKILNEGLKGDLISSRRLLAIFKNASLGMHDEKVEELTGVTSREPLYHLFGGKIQNPTASNKSPRTVVKSQPAPPTKKPGTIIKSQPGVLAPVPSGSSSVSSPSGKIDQCIAGANWSLATADKAIVDAWSIRLENPIPDCRGGNWTVCKNIMTQLSIARDHIFQTFDQNHDGVNDCKIKCLFDAAAGRAKALIAWEDWLSKRYYSGVRGLSTIFYTINERRGIPMCKQKPGNGGTSMAGGSGSGRGSGASTPSANTLHACNDPSVPVSARWKFYRYIFGGGGTAYLEKNGLICYGSNRYYTYEGGGMKLFSCDKGWTNCRRGNEKEYKYTDIVTRENGTEYQYADQGGYAVRLPNKDAPELTTIVVDDAQLASQTCARANLKSGKEWRFAGNVGYSSSYEHSGFVCGASGESVLKIAGKKLIGYTCSSGWKGCKRNKRYDADLIYPAKDFKSGDRWFSNLKVKWNGMNERELYIEKK